MATVMITLQLQPEQASLEVILGLLGLAEDEVDQRFGVVNINPSEHLYTILVEGGGRAGAGRRAGQGRLLQAENRAELTRRTGLSAC